MFFRSLAKQFFRDLKAIWPKALLLGALLIVGFYFWIPPLYRAVVGSQKTAGTPVAAVAPRARSAIEAKARFNTAPDAAQNSGHLGPSWQINEELLRSDPLVQSVEIAAIESDPFRIDYDQFHPPSLFAEEPQDEPKSDSESNLSAGGRLSDRLVLKSTIVGVTRRAAFINQRLYREGDDVGMNGETYHLEAVYPRKVLLSRGGTLFELEIVDRPKSGNIEFRRKPVAELPR